MNDFDLEAAKRGEPIDQIYKGGRINVDFIGASKRDDSIVVVDDGVRLFIAAAQELRMRPKPMRKMWVQVFKDPRFAEISITAPRSSAQEARDYATRYYSKLIGEPQQIEVPDDGDE